MELTTNNLEKISASLSLCQTEVSRVSSVSKKCFLRNLGYEGTVLASKDSIIVSLHGTETVVLIDRFLSVRCKEQCCRLVGEGTVKPFQLNDNEETTINILNGFSEVKLQPNGEKVLFFNRRHPEKGCTLCLWGGISNCGGLQEKTENTSI